MNNIKQIDAKINILRSRIILLEAQKEQSIIISKLNAEGWFIGTDFAKRLGVSRAYISANKLKYLTKIYEGREYFKLP